MGAVLQSSPKVFEALRLAGAVYLAYLGIKVWRAPVQDASTALAADGAVQAAVPAIKTGAIYREAFLVAASNPKAIFMFILPELAP